MNSLKYLRIRYFQIVDYRCTLANHNVSVKMISGSIVGRAIDAEKTDSNFQNCFNQQRTEYISINRYILRIVFVNFIILVNSI